MKKIFNKLKRNIIFIIIYVKICLIKKLYKEENIMYLLGVPWHGNMGDQAIVYAERFFLKDVCDKRIIEIPSQYLMWYFSEFKKLIKKSDVLIHGGGFIGDLWPDEDLMIRTVLDNFRNNKIIVLPQTMYFTTYDINHIEKYKKLVNKCINIQIFVREQYSYEFALKHGFNNVYLVPDMVTYLSQNDFGIRSLNYKKGTIIFCFRNDKEKVVENTLINRLKEFYQDKEISIIDTYENKTVYPVFRKRNLKRKLLQFSIGELVITDRLHGMVFAAIMETPCIVLSNCNYKIKGVYEWIKNNKYVHYVDNVEDIWDILKNIENRCECNYDNTVAKRSFNELVKAIGGNFEKVNS